MKTQLWLALLFPILISGNAWARCGTDRWAVKTGTDADINNVDLSHANPVEIAALRNLPAPLRRPQNNRIQSTEFQVFNIQARIVRASLSDDSDYHLVISDPSGLTMIAEVPDPRCVAASSQLRAQIQAARTYVDQHITITDKVQEVDIPVSIQGIGFFDFPHASETAPNGIELHPVLDIHFSNSNSAFEEFDSSESKAIPNFLQVTDQIYRGGRPGNGDLALLQAQSGVKTIIDLEDQRQAVEQERQAAARLGLQFISSPMNAWANPNDQQVADILSTLQDATKFPIFIHCHHGQDRSGLIIGLYRVTVQHWSPAQAYQEMLANGFHPELAALDRYFRTKTGYSGY